MTEKTQTELTGYTFLTEKTIMTFSCISPFFTPSIKTHRHTHTHPHTHARARTRKRTLNHTHTHTHTHINTQTHT